jgi:hypothetical protein
MDPTSSRIAEGTVATLGNSHFTGDFSNAGSGFAARTGANTPLSPDERGSFRLSQGERWYVVFAQPHREFRAHSHLAAQGFRTFLPRYRKTVRHARKLTTVSAPFFQRYFFVALDLSRDQWRAVNGTFGVTCLLTNGICPRRVPDGVVEQLVNIADLDGFLTLGEKLAAGTAYAFSADRLLIR